jgi:hypothetical protein
MTGKARNVRDVGNGKEREGFTLKKHMDKMDVDEEDDGQPMEQSYFEYQDPSIIDFSTVPSEERARNYERFGGGRQKVDSAERIVQDNHEANTLMVHYLAKSDIPPTPREPADPYNGPAIQTKNFGWPDETSPWLLERLKQNPPPPPPASNPVANIDIAALLQSIGQPQQQPQQAPAAPMPDLSAILANIAPQAQQAATTQQQGFSWPAPVPQPTATAAAPEQTNSLESILAALTGGNNAQQPQPAVPPAAPPMFQPAPATTPPTQAPNIDVNALMVQLMQNAQQGVAPAPPAANPYAAYMVPTASSDGQDTSQGYGNYYTSTSQYGAGSNNDNQQNRKREWQGNASKKYTHPCRFWKEGKCKKGDSCTFRHD